MKMNDLGIFLCLLFLPCLFHAQEWEPQAIGLLEIDEGIHSISIVSEDLVWASVRDFSFQSIIPANHSMKIIKTEDGGTNWELFEIEGFQGRVVNNIVAFDESTAIITTADYNNLTDNQGLLITEDGGVTWNNLYAEEAGSYYMRFFNEDDGVVIRNTNIAVTTDGRTAWESIPAENIPEFGESEGFSKVNGDNNCVIVNDCIWLGTSKNRVFE